MRQKIAIILRVLFIVSTVGFSAVLSVNSQTTPTATKESPESLVEDGHWKRARSNIEPRAKNNPKDGQAAYLLSKIKMAYGDWDGAVKEAERAVAVDGRNADFHFQLVWACGEVANRGSFFTKMRIGPRFKREIDAALAVNPKHLEARVGLMMFYVHAPSIMGGDTKKARALTDEILCQNPENGYFAKAMLAEEENDRAGAERFYLKVLEVNPRNYKALMSVAGIYRSTERNRPDLAEKYAREASKLEPGRAGPYRVLAAVLARQQQWTELDQTLALAEKNVPDNLSPYVEAGYALYTQDKDLPRSERYIRKYLTQEPEPGAPQPAVAHYLLGLVLEKQGRKPEAIAEINTSLRLKPDYENAKKALKRLKG
ncbi:MAG TPA: tetratricopeptide repeat protein [Acidobacteriota bacterium]